MEPFVASLGRASLENCVEEFVRYLCSLFDIVYFQILECIVAISLKNALA